MKSYTANALNQYTAIANPDAVALRGVATNTATVTVNGSAASRDSIASDTVPWHYALLADNANGGVFTFAEIMAVVNPPGTNTPDIVFTASGSVYAPPQAEALTYDDDGNLLNDGRFNYTWNGENRLIKAEEQVCPTNRTLRKVEYAYDHQGRMVWKVVSRRGAEAQSWETEKTVAYLWDGYNIIAETVASDSATNVTYNIWGLDLDGSLQGAGGVGGLLAVIKDSATYVPAWDANGNIMEYVSSDGIIVAHREYDPFGGTVVYTSQSAITNQQSAISFAHWFSTKPWCPVTGLSEYQYRKYSPAMGRWLNRDPIGEKGGVALYVLCFNRTLLSADALGLKKNEMPISPLDLIDYGISNQKKIYHTSVRVYKGLSFYRWKDCTCYFVDAYQVRQIDKVKRWKEIWAVVNTPEEILQGIAEDAVLENFVIALTETLSISAGQLLKVNELVNFDLLEKPDRAHALYSTQEEEGVDVSMLGSWQDYSGKGVTFPSPTKEGCLKSEFVGYDKYVEIDHLLSWDRETDNFHVMDSKLNDIEKKYLNKSSGGYP